MNHFFDALNHRVAEIDSVLCVGIDPVAGSPGEAKAIAMTLIEQTAPFAAAFKPNAAFFEALGPEGVEVLIEVIAAIPDEIPVLLDAKRGDIGSSAERYAVAALQTLGANGVTVNPYLGFDSIAQFLAHEGAGVWVLCRTSNPSGATFQDLQSGGRSLSEHVAAAAVGWAGPDRIGLVVGATTPDDLARIRRVAPEHWILAPGVGAQGASPTAIGSGLRDDGRGVLVPVSRSIANATDPATAAANLRDQLRLVTRVDPPPPALATRLFDTGVITTGEFELRSGAKSPVYLDLRRLTGHPALLNEVSFAVGAVLANLEYDQIGAVPYGALPLATAVAGAVGAPMLWARPTAKEHGTRQQVEGAWMAGQRVVLIDDVATSGGSAIDTARVLRASGLVVNDLVVVVERGSGARRNLATEHITLYSILSLADVAEQLEASGRIDRPMRQELDAMWTA